MLVMLVKLGLGIPIGHPIEIIEQRQLGVLPLSRWLLFGCLGTLAIARHADQIVDEHLRMHLLLDIQRWCMDDQVRPVLLILAPPNKLRIQVRVARIPYRHRRLLIVADHGAILDRRYVLPLVVGVPNGIDGLDGLFVAGLFRHGESQEWLVVGGWWLGKSGEWGVVRRWGVFVRVGFDRVAKLHKFRGVYPDQMSEYVSG